MDILYDRIENYEDENIVDELRRENGALKCKLEEYSVAIDRLQKDFDKLSSEFKKLEMNYSSLLKTAKEEIERKTQMINKLNIEKDMMVLNAIQNKNLSVMRRRRFMPLSKSNDRSTDTAKVSNIDGSKTRESTDFERKRQNLLSSEETTSSANSDIVTNADKAVDRLRKTYDAKENVAKDETRVSKPKPMSISNRRKSLPATRSDVKFSSDEDEDSYCTPGSKYQIAHKNIKPQDLKTVHDKHRLLDERYRTSETSSMDDRYSNYRTRSTRYDSHRNNRDRFDSQKHKRHSPERFRRTTRNYSNERNARQEYNRHRIIESPPPDRYHNRNQTRSRDRRSRYENSEHYDYEKAKDPSQDTYTAKHKLHHDSEEEPSTKRRRNDSHNRDRKEEKGWDIDRGSLQMTASIENVTHTYCQSPDYSVIQDTVAQPREIKNTAVTQLEDPRLLSLRYIAFQGNKGVSTVMGRNVDLKVIDTSNWEIERVKMPKALTRRPSQCSEDIVHNVYMDIDNPDCNISLESGEIGETDDLEIFKTEQKIHGKPQNHDKAPDSTIDRKCFNALTEKPPNKDLNKYTIPKLRRETQKCTASKTSNDTKVENNLRKENSIDNISKNKPSSLSENTHSNEAFKNTQCQNSNKLAQVIETSDSDAEKIRQEPPKPTNKPIGSTIVKGDFELSDETCNKTDVPKEFIPETNTTTKDRSESNIYKCSQLEVHKDEAFPEIIACGNTRPPSEPGETDDLEIFKSEQKFHGKPQNHDKVPDSAVGSKCLNAYTEKPPTKDLSKYTTQKLRKEPQKCTASNTSNDTKVENSLAKENIIENISKKESSSLAENTRLNEGLERTHSKNSNKLAQVIGTFDSAAEKIRQEPPKPTKTPIVEGDLELSDETCDNTDVPKKFIPKTNSSTANNRYESNQYKCSQVEVHKNEAIPEIIASVSTKPPRSKRKTQKTTVKESSKKDKVETNIEKRTRQKRDKKETKEIKAKFSELFGDTTSSLITPEDLGIASESVVQTFDKYIPICEDAQDAVLMKPLNVEAGNITTNTTPLTTLLTKNVTVKCNKEIETSTKFKTDKDNSDNKKRKLKINEAEKAISCNSSEIQPESINELPDAIKLQELHRDQLDVQKVVVTNDFKNLTTQKTDLLNALATSTPYKEVRENPNVIDPSTTNTSYAVNFKHDIIVSVDDSTDTDQCSNNKTLDSQTEADAPDVRIFVKRRRKIMRKSKP